MKTKRPENLRLLLKTALPHNQAQGFTSGAMAGRDLPR